MFSNFHQGSQISSLHHIKSTKSDVIGKTTFKNLYKYKPISFSVDERQTCKCIWSALQFIIISRNWSLFSHALPLTIWINITWSQGSSCGSTQELWMAYFFLPLSPVRSNHLGCRQELFLFHTFTTFHTQMECGHCHIPSDYNHVFMVNYREKQSFDSMKAG